MAMLVVPYLGLISFLFLFQLSIPQPESTWQVSFAPESALVWENGRVMLFDGKQAYVYGPDGQLMENFVLPAEVEAAYPFPDNQALIYFNNQLLANLGGTGGLRWQKEFQFPAVTPEPFEKCLIWAQGPDVAVLDPKDGSTRYSLRLEAAVVSTQVLDGWIWITDSRGETIAWEPLTGKKEPRLQQDKAPLSFVSKSPIGERALISRGGQLSVERADGKPLWQRHLHIDIAAPAVFLQGEHKPVMLVATMGRNLFVYGGSRGEQLGRRLIGGRPKALVAFGQSHALLVSERVSAFLWYDALKRRFSEEPTEGRTLYVTTSASTLLLVGENGIIRLYRLYSR